MISELGRGLRDIGQDLTNIEVNTILTDSISGRKMPSYPHALLDIAQKYADYMTGLGVGLNLDHFARRFCNGPAASDQDTIKQVTPPIDLSGDQIDFHERQVERNTARQKQDGSAANLEERLNFMRQVKPQFIKGGTHYSFLLTNGWETFELLRWAANNSLYPTPNGGGNQPTGSKGPNPIKSETVRAIIFRILRNCDQLKVVADDLRGSENGDRFIGLTRRDLVNLNEVPKIAPPHHLTRIRKVWDLGTDRIVFQTVVQLDGDIIFRASGKQLKSTENPLVQAHERALATGLGYWHQLFTLVFSLITEKIGQIFDPNFETKDEKKKSSTNPS